MKLFKKTAALIFTLLMSLSLLASCSGVPEQKKEEKKLLKQENIYYII